MHIEEVLVFIIFLLNIRAHVDDGKSLWTILNTMHNTR